MSLAHHGIDIPPNLLNDLLKANNGYTKRGWLKWNSVSKITNGRIYFDILNGSNTAVIDNALKAKQPVIAKIVLYGFFTHWVLIVGKVGSDYLVKDPLGDGKSLKRLSHYKTKIYAIRIMRTNN